MDDTYPQHDPNSDHGAWVHDLHDDDETCAQIDANMAAFRASPRPCCGRPRSESEVTRVCRFGNCTEEWCVCGEFLRAGWGPVGCPCQSRPPWTGKRLCGKRRNRGHRRKMDRLDTRNWVNAIKLGPGALFPLVNITSRWDAAAWQREQVAVAIRTAGWTRVPLCSGTMQSSESSESSE